MQQLFFPIKLKLIIATMFFLVLPLASAAHYIVGVANDALDGTGADDLSVVLWNPSVGIQDNLTDIIGANGNSGVSNLYLIDCEMLGTPCSVGDTLSIKIFSSPFSENVSVVVTGAGFDVAPNITLNSPLNFSSVIADDFLSTPANEIDLLAGSSQTVTCEAVIEDLDGISLQNISSEFFDNSVSFFGDFDDNNSHYTNSSCFLNESYGDNYQDQVICNFEVLYNANSGEWNCTIYAEDNFSAAREGSNTTNINQLLSLQAPDSIDFGSTSSDSVTDESVINITNMGNVAVNLSLSGEGMVCSTGTIPVYYKKYNLTSSTPGVLDLGEFESTYTNLTSSSITKEFNLNYRQNEGYNEAVNSTYWRVYVPLGVSGDCQGNITLGAVIGGGT